MADKPEDVVQMYHAEASPDTPVEVTRHEFESVWKAVGWRLTQAKKKEGN